MAWWQGFRLSRKLNFVAAASGSPANLGSGSGREVNEQIAMSFFLTSAVSMLVVLGIMVLVHEFGHFAVAKLCGVRVEVFSVGFGKRLFGFRRGDTDYRLSLLPLGGYVKMSGESPGEETTGDPAEFIAHPRWQRILIGLAGPVVNFLLALVLMTGFYMMHNEVEAFRFATGRYRLCFRSHRRGQCWAFSRATSSPNSTTSTNPTWEQVSIRAALNLGQTVTVEVNRGGQTISTHSWSMPNPARYRRF